SSTVQDGRRTLKRLKQVWAIRERTLSWTRPHRLLDVLRQLFCVLQLVLPTGSSSAFRLDPYRRCDCHRSGMEAFKAPLLTRQTRSTQMPATVDALEMLWTGLDGKTCQAKAVWRHMQAVSLGVEVLKCRLITERLLNAFEFIDNRAMNTITL